MNYNQVFISRTSLGTPFAFECDACGALVKNKDLHDKFHEGQRRVADDASWGAMLRPLG